MDHHGGHPPEKAECCVHRRTRTGRNLVSAGNGLWRCRSSEPCVSRADREARDRRRSNGGRQSHPAQQPPAATPSSRRSRSRRRRSSRDVKPRGHHRSHHQEESSKHKAPSSTSHPALPPTATSVAEAPVPPDIRVAFDPEEEPVPAGGTAGEAGEPAAAGTAEEAPQAEEVAGEEPAGGDWKVEEETSPSWGGSDDEQDGAESASRPEGEEAVVAEGAEAPEGEAAEGGPLEGLLDAVEVQAAGEEPPAAETAPPEEPPASTLHVGVAAPLPPDRSVSQREPSPGPDVLLLCVTHQRTRTRRNLRRVPGHPDQWCCLAEASCKARGPVSSSSRVQLSPPQTTGQQRPAPPQRSSHQARPSRSRSRRRRRRDRPSRGREHRVEEPAKPRQSVKLSGSHRSSAPKPSPAPPVPTAAPNRGGGSGPAGAPRSTPSAPSPALPGPVGANPAPGPKPVFCTLHSIWRKPTDMAQMYLTKAWVCTGETKCKVDRPTPLAAPVISVPRPASSHAAGSGNPRAQRPELGSQGEGGAAEKKRSSREVRSGSQLRGHLKLRSSRTSTSGRPSGRSTSSRPVFNPPDRSHSGAPRSSTKIRLKSPEKAVGSGSRRSSKSVHLAPADHSSHQGRGGGHHGSSGPVGSSFTGVAPPAAANPVVLSPNPAAPSHVEGSGSKGRSGWAPSSHSQASDSHGAAASQGLDNMGLCSVHNKKRFLDRLERQGDVWVCKPHDTCTDDQGKCICSVHQRPRRKEFLEKRSGSWVCKPGRECGRNQTSR